MEHFTLLRSFTMDLFTHNEEKAILAEGERLFTALFHYYLEEQKIPSVLLPALNFMRIDENSEPDLEYIEEHLKKELAKHPATEMFITQGYICRNSFGQTDNLKRGGSDYTASLIGAAINAMKYKFGLILTECIITIPVMCPISFPLRKIFI